MEFRFETIEPILICCYSLEMNLLDYKAVDLWNRFMPLRNSIENKIDSNLYSITKHSNDYFNQFSPAKPFMKYAGVAVTKEVTAPNDFTCVKIEGGNYVVFNYKGSSAKANEAFNNIFTNWFPKSEFKIATDRFHFEILGEKYKKNSDDSEEEIWIPILRK